MYIKSILKYFPSMLLVFCLLVSCDDDSSSPDINPLSVSTPSVQNLIIDESVDISFQISTSAGYSSAGVEATNGAATIFSEPSAGATSGEVVVSFTANTPGAGSVVLTVTDADGQTDDATAVISITEEETTILITENITSDTTWKNGSTYILGGRIAVEAGATLTIEAGTVIKGEAGTGANATALLIARDAMLNANGTADAPIIFTSVADELSPEMVANGTFGSPNLDPDIEGLWGGLIVLGNAPISASTSPTQIEGIPTSDTSGLYGGNDPEDSSGSITYISIRHGGSNIGEGNEINGLTLGGVGRGTVIENVEIVANQDDGVEFFGGTVNVKNVLVWNSFDDAVDTDQAWSGTIDNFAVISPGGSAFELDGPEGSFTSNGHTITNGTVYMIGNSGELLIDVDANTDVYMSDILFFGLATTAEGAAANSISSDYPDFASNAEEYTITSLEAVIPDGLTVEDYFHGLESETTAISGIGEATVGADMSVFDFTWANQSGTISEIGL